MSHAIVRCVAVTLATVASAGGWSVAHADEAASPCNLDTRFNQQDFTLGDWDVYLAGNKAASVHLEKVLNGCAIQETWMPLEESGEHGTGLFTYSRLLGHWGYFWVDDKGQTTAFTGDQQGSNGMLYLTYAPVTGGGRKERHWTLILQPDGSIQELARGSVDGKNWSNEYELIWRRRK